MLVRLRKCVLIAIAGSICVCGAVAAPAQNSGNLPIEIFQVLDLPVSVHEALLVKTDKGYLLKVELSNSNESKMMGVRYSLSMIDADGAVVPVTSRTEGLSLAPYAMKSITFKTPIKFKSKGGDRLVLMVEQNISQDSIWDVLKSKEALAAYAKGDYSVVPTVLRVSNQVDAPHIAPLPLRMPRP